MTFIQKFSAIPCITRSMSLRLPNYRVGQLCSILVFKSKTMSLNPFIAVATFHCVMGSRQNLVRVSTFEYNFIPFVQYFAVLVVSLNCGNSTSLFLWCGLDFLKTCNFIHFIPLTCLYFNVLQKTLYCSYTFSYQMIFYS